jgi:microcystin-dependent protein
MAEPFLSEIRVLSFGFAPRGWALCNGQLLPINQNAALFSLLGTTYGGNGTTNFALPDFRGRVPLHEGNGHLLGSRGGTEAHTLQLAEMPTHQHTAKALPGAGDTATATNAVLAQGLNVYASAPPTTTLNASASATVGGSQPHLNMQPYCVLNLCIALQGIFPSPS